MKRERELRIELEWKLRQLIAKTFSKSSEKIDPAQLQLLLEAGKAVQSEGQQQQAQAQEKQPEKPIQEKKRYRSKRMRMPEEMREEMREEIVEVDLPEEERICPDTGKERKLIRWEESIKINYVPGGFVRVRIRRAVRAVSSRADDPVSDEPMVTAEMPAAYRVLGRCIAASGLLVYLMVAKYCDHLPFYRIQQIFKRRHRVWIARTTMCHWTKRCAAILEVLYEALRLELLSGNYLQIDETFIKLLDPDVKGKAREIGLNAAARGALRAEKSKPILDGIKERLDADLSNGEILPSSPLGKAVRYSLSLWPGLIRYAEEENGDVEIDNNEVENAIRPTAIGEKNWLFIGHPKAGKMSAIIYTIIENCRLHDIDPMEYLLDVLPRIEDHPKRRVAELLPRAWKAAQEAKRAA